MIYKNIIGTEHIKILEQIEEINEERDQVKKWFWLFSIGGFFVNLIILFILTVFIKSLFSETFSIEATIIICSAYIVSVLFSYIFVIFHYSNRIENQGLRIMNEILIEKEHQKATEK